MHKISNRYGVRIVGGLAIASVLIAGCRRSEQGPVTITETRPAAPLRDIPPNDMDTKARLGMDAMPHNHPTTEGKGSSMPAAAADTSLVWTVPEGWTQGAARPMRSVTFTCGAEGAVECYVAELGGMGGGVAANFNRWRGQLAQKPLSEADITALPRITVLGSEAPFLEATGTYSGMGQGQAAQADSKLLGTMAASGDRAFFVKMVGPAAAVDAQRENFKAFCTSLKLGE